MNRIYKNKVELIRSLIQKDDIVLDVGFWGQGVGISDKNWPHRLILRQSGNVYGLDIDFDIEQLENKSNYKKSNAENFNFDIKFDVIFASDLIEHLSNQGLFLDSCKRNLKQGGKLIITTPNSFNLYNISGKIMNSEPVVNKDHTCYHNIRTIKSLLRKNGWEIKSVGFIYALGYNYKESFKKKVLNFIYFILSKFTDKYIETLVLEVVSKKKY